MAGNDGPASILGVAMRVATLNADGTVTSGSPMYVTDTLTKITLTPNVEAGEDFTVKNAAGNLCVRTRLADKVKYYDVDLSICAVDPELEQMISGGVVLTDTTVALTAPATPTTTPASTGGVLPAGTTWVYTVTALGRYGETVASTASTAATTTGSTSKITVSWVAVTGAAGYRVYGRVAGSMYLLGSVAAGTTSFVDTGLPAVGGVAPAANSTAGPGTVGYAAPALGVAENPVGVSLEVWSQALVNGVAPATGGGPYIRWVIPMAKNFTHQGRSIENAVMANDFKGEAYENPNWGTGPAKDWPFTSGRVWQRARESQFPTPSVGVQTIP